MLISADLRRMVSDTKIKSVSKNHKIVLRALLFMVFQVMHINYSHTIFTIAEKRVSLQSVMPPF